MADINILHNEQSQTFYLPLNGNKEAVLQYRLTEGNGSAPTTIDFTRTYVPPDSRGQGIAEALVRQGIKWARQKNFRMTASCWYAAKFLGKDMGVMAN